MESKRLRSYEFRCPCCSEPHRREFKYFARFMGEIPEEDELPKDREVTMVEMAVMKDQTVFEESRSMSLGDSVFRCGKCHEFFKFLDPTSNPSKLQPDERKVAENKFKPITVVKRNAVLNSIGSLVSLLNKYGCIYDEDTNSIVIRDENGKEYDFAIADQLFNAFYGNNPMFDVKKTAHWAFTEENAEQKASNM